MKNNIIKAGLFCLLITSFSCSKKIDEVYRNPNADVRVAPEELLPQIISAMAANYGGHGTMPDMRYVGQYIQNFSFYSTQSVFDKMGYNNSVGDVAQSTWRMHYYDIGQNNQRMMQWAAEEEKWDYVGVGKAIEAWSWLTLTDYYDNVILKDAFNTSKITFSYSTQPEVYDYVKSLAYQALENLNKTGGNVSQANLAKGDAYLYNGDVNKWKKFAYSVLARVHNRYSNKSTYKPDSVIYYAKLGIINNADNALVKFAATAISATHNFFGPLRANLTGTTAANPTAIRQGQYIANLLNGTNTAFAGVQDPRAIYLLRLNNNNTFVGVPPIVGQTSGLTAGDRPENFWGVSQFTAASNASTPAPVGPRFIFRNDAPFPIITAAEMQFLKAEAEFKSGSKGLALASYTEGIKQHFDMLTSTYNVNVPASMQLTTALRDAYLADPKVVPTNSNNLTLSQIMLQKYIAMFGYGILETWVDMRRYHYIDADPSGVGQIYRDFTPPSSGDLFPDNNGELIYRYYPRFNSEYVWNINELNRIGATKSNYHSNKAEKIWFALP